MDPRRVRFATVLLPILLVGWIAGCSDDSGSILSPATPEEEAPAVIATNPPPPAELAVAAFAGEDVTFWPYTGSSFSGEAIDPVNLLFCGNADPVAIRAALLALGGDRTAFGFPDAFPFNATWSDAIGDVQSCYAEGDGWVGSIVQLQLADYEPIRWHLRLFQTGDPFGGTGVWTIGAAHFEVMIPGTADHQVLSWERAEEIVLVDFLRSGLLDPNLPFAQSGLINAAPSFREIPAVIYNGIPEELKVYIGGPLGQVSEPVPILTDGRATILNIAGGAPIIPGSFVQSFVKTYEMIMPKPFCSDGPYDWVLATGPVAFQKTVTVEASGRFSCQAEYGGTLAITPWDIVNNQPAGDPYPADVGGLQHGRWSERRSSVSSHERRLGHGPGGTEAVMTWLSVSTPGQKSYRERTHCL